MNDMEEDRCYWEDFGGNLKSIREEKGMTALELGVEACIPSIDIELYEGGVRYPNIRNLESLCQVLDCTAFDLLGY